MSGRFYRAKTSSAVYKKPELVASYPTCHISIYLVEIGRAIRLPGNYQLHQDHNGQSKPSYRLGCYLKSCVMAKDTEQDLLFKPCA